MHSVFLRFTTVPRCCSAPVCPVRAACPRRRAWRSPNRTWRRSSEFWLSTRFDVAQQDLHRLPLPRQTHFPLLLSCVASQKCDASKHKVLVASVCPQSLPFFAVKFGVDITDAAHKLCGFLKSIGEQASSNNHIASFYEKITFMFSRGVFLSW